MIRVRITWLLALPLLVGGGVRPLCAQDASEPPALSLDEALSKALEALRHAEKGQQDRTRYITEVTDLLRAAQQQDPNNPKVEFYSARLLILIGRSKDAVRTIEKYVKTREGQDDWEAYKILGELYAEGPYWTLARTSYETASKLNPRDPDAFMGLAHCYLQLSKPDEALKQIETAVALSPSDPKVRDLHAQILLRLNQPDAALKAAVQAVDLARAAVSNNPGSLQVLQELDARYSSLETTLTAAIRKSPKTSELYLRAARSIEERQQVSNRLAMNRQLTVLTQGIEATEPRVPVELRLERTRLLILLSRIEDAEAELIEIDKIDPTNPSAKQLREAIEQYRARTAATDGK